MNFAIETLFFTNAWVIIYTRLITFLNFLFPPILREQFYRLSAAFPEPFEMPLYLIITGVFVIFIWSLNQLFINIRLFTTFAKKSLLFRFVKLVIFVVLALVFLTKLGHYPLGGDPFPYAVRPDKSIYFFIVFIYLALAAFCIIQSALVENLSKKQFVKTILYAIVLLVIAILTFEPRFPISAHEYGYFFAPIWDVSHGKTLFTDIHVDYGFYATLFFSMLYRLGLFTFSQLPVYVWLMFIAQYFLSFYLIYKTSKSLALALLGLFSIITVNYFSFILLPITITQYSAMRRLPSVFLLFLLYRYKKIDSAKLLIIFSFFSFWITDIGVSMILALETTCTLLLLMKQLSIKQWLRFNIILVLFVFGFFLLIDLGHVVLAYKPINPVDIFASLRQHAGSGLTMLPIASHTYFWVVMLIYFATIIYCLRNTRTSLQYGQPNGLSLPLLATNLTLFNALYFVGRSHDANLIDISIVVLLNFFLLLGVIWRNLQSSIVKIAIGIFLFFLMIVIPAYQRRHHLTEFILEKYKRFTQGNIFKPETDEILEKAFADERRLILNYLPDQEILILSREDTYLLILSGKKNLLGVNPQSGIDTLSEMDFAVKRVIKACPNKIAVDCRLFKKCPDYQSYSQKSLFMAPYILGTIEKKCAVTYQPVLCNNKLCIAEFKKR